MGLLLCSRSFVVKLNGKYRFQLSGILVFVLSVGALANSSPVVSSITVSQWADTSKLVDIHSDCAHRFHQIISINHFVERIET
jgi:hypothetical protein